MNAPAPLPVALVVEDDDLIGHLLKFILERAGYRVDRAVDGRQAQEYITTQPAPAIALLDMMLPFIDGLELIRLVRSQAGWEGVPALMLSAKSQERDIQQALEAGADDYIVKPFQPADLLERLRAFAGRKA